MRVCSLPTPGDTTDTLRRSDSPFEYISVS